MFREKRTPGDRAHAIGKRRHERKSRPSIFRDHDSVDRRERACSAGTGSWLRAPAASQMLSYGALTTVPGLGPAPRRSALRANRSLARAERRFTANK